jgi:hypothetical protein
MKALKALLLCAVVLGVIAAGAASLWFGRGVKLAVERYAPGIVGAPVTVGAVILTPWSGRGSVTNLVIGNPPGYKGAHAVSVGSVEVKLELSSLASDTIVVESVVVRDPEIVYEVGSGGSNLSRLQKNAEGAKGKSASDPAESGGGKSLFIKDLLVTGGQVGVSASALGSQSVKLPLPGVHLTNLGGKGRSPAEAASEVLSAISASAGKAVAGLGGKALNEAATQVMGRLGGLLKGKK